MSWSADPKVDDVGWWLRFTCRPEGPEGLLGGPQDGCWAQRAHRVVVALLERAGLWMHKFLVDVDNDKEHVTRDVEQRLSISRQRFDVA
jgi:hypothetical protein